MNGKPNLPNARHAALRDLAGWMWADQIKRAPDDFGSYDWHKAYDRARNAVEVGRAQPLEAPHPRDVQLVGLVRAAIAAEDAAA